MNSQPPMRCVRTHAVLLDSVHGVRSPRNQLGRSFPSSRQRR
jgi:hypothetical protein